MSFLAEGLTGSRVLRAFQGSETYSRTIFLTSLRTKYPKLSTWTDDEVESFCRASNSYSQSRRSRAGKELETLVEIFLGGMNVPFARQVPINKDGIIQAPTHKSGMKVIDIVFGAPVPGDSITNYAVMSLKTSSRERGSEDDWTFVHPPKLYLYGTISADYPPPEKFLESEKRKLVCAVPRPTDTRVYKLNFEDVVPAIQLV